MVSINRPFLPTQLPIFLGHFKDPLSLNPKKPISPVRSKKGGIYFDVDCATFRRQGEYRYMGSTVLSHIGANSSSALLLAGVVQCSYTTKVLQGNSALLGFLYRNPHQNRRPLFLPLNFDTGFLKFKGPGPFKGTVA